MDLELKEAELFYLSILIILECPNDYHLYQKSNIFISTVDFSLKKEIVNSLKSYGLISIHSDDNMNYYEYGLESSKFLLGELRDGGREKLKLFVDKNWILFESLIDKWSRT